MSRLTFIRHGQASFLSADYDNLSASGKLQATQLADYWAKHEIVFDEVYSGPLKRQQQTAKIVRAQLVKNNGPSPEIQTLEEFAEHQLDRLFDPQTSPLQKRSDELKRLSEEFFSAQVQRKQKTYDRLYGAISNRWLADEDLGIESWRDFKNVLSVAFSELLTARGPLGELPYSLR